MPDTTIEYSIIDNGGHGTVSVVLDGLHVLPSGHANYAAVVALLTGSDLSEQAVRDRLGALLTGKAPATAEADDVAEDVQDGGDTAVELSERTVLGQETGLLVDGTIEVTNALTQAIVDLVDRGANESLWAPLVRLLEKQVDAESHSLYDWASLNSAAINDDGSVVGYIRTLRHPSGAYGVEMDQIDGQFVAKVDGPDRHDSDELVTTVLVEPADVVVTEDDYLLVGGTRVVAVGEPRAANLDEGEIAHLRPSDDGYGIAGQLAQLLRGDQEHDQD